MKTRILSAGAAALLLAVHAPTEAQTRAHAAAAVDTLEIRAHTRFLADDLLRGRGAGSDGERLAAAYIESQLIRLGLAPLGTAGDFMLPVPLHAATIAPGTRLTVRGGGYAGEYASPLDFIVSTGGAEAFRDFGGTVLFAGAPIEAGAALRDADLAGAVIAVTGALGATATELVPDWARRGAAGIVILSPDPAGFNLIARSRGTDRLYVDTQVNDPVWQPSLPTLVLGPLLSEALLRHAGERYAARPAGSRADAAVATDWRIDAEIRVERRRLEAANVAGLLRGSDPRLRDELVVYTAHYDHLGVSIPDVTGDSIYNGFSDNAAGVAILLAIAERLRHEPPARSVLFLFLTAEERGLLGSSYFAAAPPVPLDRIRAVINLDAGAPPAPPTSWRVAAGPNSQDLVSAAQATAARSGWRTDVGPATPNSDHWPFAARGVPAIFIIPGSDWENTSAAEAARLRERFERYHQPGDIWRAEFPFAGLGRYADFALEVGLRLAN
jgi:hypothetical protein